MGGREDGFDTMRDEHRSKNWPAFKRAALHTRSFDVSWRGRSGRKGRDAMKSKARENKAPATG